jgi:hydrogenase/urease accessory protein HupE
LRASWLFACVALAPVLLGESASAHRLTPAYLGLTETAPGTFQVQWKVSNSGGLTAVLVPGIPDGCELTGPVRTTELTDARTQSGEIYCPAGVRGLRFGVEGLEATHTDVLFRIGFADGDAFVHRLTPADTDVTVPAQASRGAVAGIYLVLGIEHILIGIDHLLFVLALLLIVRGIWQLVATVTAFTIAHSITLGAAALGWVAVPEDPVEAVIALSILFLAWELLREPGDRAQASLAFRFPWLVAFTFGLLHGFGFAGALFEVGLPDHAIPLALLFFNIGVEIGQLMFIAAVFAVVWLVRRTRVTVPEWWPRATAYGIGSLAAFWVIERTLPAF